MKQLTIVLDGIALIINRDNPVANLDMEQIHDIFIGKITNWKQIGGHDAQIHLIIREAGSGTRDAFEELTGLLGKDGSMAAEQYGIIVDSTNAVSQCVSRDEKAIGYVSLGSIDPATKLLMVNGVVCNAENIRSGTYALARPFLFVTKQHTDSKKIDAFINYVLGEEGQTIVAEEKFVPVK